MKNLVKAIILFSLICLPPGLQSQENAYEFNSGLTIPLIGQYGREAVSVDELLYQMAVDSFHFPEEGKLFAMNRKDEPVAWEAIRADDKNWFQNRNLRGGYLALIYHADKSQAMILEVNGHSELYFNGAPRGGDVYGYGWVQHPVEVKKGQNLILIRGARGRVQAKLTQTEQPVFLSERDLLVPDLIIGDASEKLGAIRVINTGKKAISGYRIQTIMTDGKVCESTIPVIEGFSSRKVPFRVAGSSLSVDENVSVEVQLIDSRGRIISSLKEPLSIPVKQLTDTHKETFISEIDGSVQYYSVVPPTGGFQDSLALFISLHGASVEAVNQANAYQSKEWGTLVAPTNRRPYGFDWEDWGRLDAMEVLRLAKQRYAPDENRIYLTGHSMGGHGAWQIGVTYPGCWAAIAPSAGWYSFWSYAGKEQADDENPVDMLINRSTNPSNTLDLSQNFLQHGIYVLHGDEDDNVPVSQARFMRSHLGKYHADFSYYERPGAGHWWGNECVDWPPLFDFFKTHVQLPEQEIKRMEFVTASPGVSSQSRHLRILQQNIPLDFSSLKYNHDIKNKSIRIETENVASFSIRLESFQPVQTYEIFVDSLPFRIESGSAEPVIFAFKDTWKQVDEFDTSEKNPDRSGLFKDAFKNRMVFVYGTNGTKQENEWAFNKARFDAETFWYRGNGSVDIIPDRNYDPVEFAGRNVILFGHADMNSAWEVLLKHCPIQMNRDKLTIGTRKYSGNDIGGYFVYPIRNSEIATVGVIAGTGLPGLKAADPNRYFVSGSGFPDFIFFRTDMLRSGKGSVFSTGYFDNEWLLDSEQFYCR